MISILRIFLLLSLLSYSLDSEFLVSTSIDGSARLWKLTDGTPLMNLDRSAVYSAFLFTYFPFGNGKQLLFVFVVGEGRSGLFDAPCAVGSESTSYRC